MFDLKVDPQLPHHYIIGVCMHTMRSSTPGKMFLKYGPVYFTNDDVQKVADSLLLLDDKIYRDIYKMTATEIYHTIGSAELIMSMIGLKMAAQANDTTLHHFSCEWPIHGAEKFFEGYVERANKFDKELKGLKDAEIRGA